MNLHYRLPYFNLLYRNLFFSEKSFLYVCRMLIFRRLKWSKSVHIVLQFSIEIFFPQLCGLYSRILWTLNTQLVLTLRYVRVVNISLNKRVLRFRGHLCRVFFERFLYIYLWNICFLYIGVQIWLYWSLYYYFGCLILYLWRPISN
jgi:hypothetical protein